MVRRAAGAAFVVRGVCRGRCGVPAPAGRAGAVRLGVASPDVLGVAEGVVGDGEVGWGVVGGTGTSGAGGTGAMARAGGVAGGSVSSSPSIQGTATPPAATRTSTAATGSHRGWPPGAGGVDGRDASTARWAGRARDRPGGLPAFRAERRVDGKERIAVRRPAPRRGAAASVAGTDSAASAGVDVAATAGVGVDVAAVDAAGVDRLADRAVATDDVPDRAEDADDLAGAGTVSAGLAPAALGGALGTGSVVGSAVRDAAVPGRADVATRAADFLARRGAATAAARTAGDAATGRPAVPVSGPLVVGCSDPSVGAGDASVSGPASTPVSGVVGSAGGGVSRAPHAGLRQYALPLSSSVPHASQITATASPSGHDRSCVPIVPTADRPIRMSGTPAWTATASGDRRRFRGAEATGGAHAATVPVRAGRRGCR